MFTSNFLVIQRGNGYLCDHKFYILSHTHTTHRLGMLPSLARLQSECGVFQSTAIRDLNISIDRLEKARTDYRAALLWMKDVSEKLHNPDYHNQLAKFREVCVMWYIICMCVYLVGEELTQCLCIPSVPNMVVLVSQKECVFCLVCPTIL